MNLYRIPKKSQFDTELGKAKDLKIKKPARKLAFSIKKIKMI
jgi:hypothetical protein